MIILDTAIWGPINETFRAKFISLRESAGEEIALRKTKSLLVFTVVVSCILVSLVMLFPSLLGKLVAPSYKGQDLEMLLQMLIMVAPCFFFNQLVQVGISLLNAYESFYVPEISSFASVVLNLVLIILLAPKIGIYALLVAYYIGVIILVFLVLFEIRKLKIQIFTNYQNFRWKDCSIFIIFALPFFFPYFLGQISAIIEKTIASSLIDGTVSTIDYSRKFTDMFLSVLSGVLTTILVPILSLKFAQKQQEGFVSGFLEIYQLGFLAITFMVVMFTACPDAFVDILYNKGAISPERLHDISQLTMFYSWSGFSIFMYLVFGLVLLSSGMRKRYAFWGVFAQVFSMILNLGLVRTFGVNIFPIASFLSHLIAACVMLNSFPYSKRIVLIKTVRYLIVLLVTIAIMYGLNYLKLIPFVAFGKILVNGCILSVLLILMTFILKLDERHLITKFGNRILKRTHD